MAFLFDPKCNSNLSVLEVGEVRACYAISNYILWGVAAVASSMWIATSPKVNQKLQTIAVTLLLCGLLAALTSPLATFVGQRLKQSQSIDESRLAASVGSAQTAKLATFADHAFRKGGGGGSLEDQMRPM